MNDIIFYLLAGIGVGSLYALLGTGLVVVYKGSGVINFAQGAMAMYGVATFDRAWNQGEIFLPWVDILPTDSLNLPVQITLSDSGEVPMGVALVIALLMAALLGLAAHFLVFRPLRHAAPLGKVVASLGLALYLQGVALLNFGTSYPTPKSVYPNPNSAFENFLGLGQPVPPQQPVRLLRRRSSSVPSCGACTSSPASAWRPAPRRATRRAPSCSATRRSDSPRRTGSPPRCWSPSPPSSSGRSRARSRRSASPR